MIGTTIDQYRIEQRLGGGGMGEVFRARDLELDRDVAIKLVRPELSDLDEVTARFRAEARTLAGLAHANIATVFRFFPHEGTLYLVMEYISGQPFGDMLRDQGARPPAEVVHLLTQALAGLGYAHDNKVVHRDIKPGNLMLDGHNTVKVLDFGIAHLLDQTRITQSGSVLGTPAYMAPEQVLGQQVDGRTDLYALGVVLFELLTGQLPFRANSQFELMRAHLETHPRSLQEMTDTVPQPLQETVVRALAKDSTDRYQTAAQFSTALEDALAQSAADGTDIATVAGAARSPVKVAVSTPAPATVPSNSASSGDTEIRMPTSVEIPLPQPKTAAGVGVAAVLLAGAGIWWVAGSGPDSTNSAVTASSLTQQVTVPSAEPVGATPSAIGTEGASRATDTLGRSYTPSTSDPAQLSSQGSNAQSTGAVMGSDDPGQVWTAVAPAANVVAPTQATPAPTVTAKPTVARQQTQAPAPRVSTRAPTRISTGRYVVRATKVSVHERQRTGFLSRAAGYNGSFALSAPQGAQPLQIDELVEVYRNGQRLTRQVINSQVRKPGRFKSKQRIPGLKELGPGNYQMRLLFESDGRKLGQHEWTLVVSG